MVDIVALLQCTRPHVIATTSNSHFEEERVTSHLGAGFSWERRRLACSGSGQDGRAPRGFGNGDDPHLRLLASQRAKMRIAEQPLSAS